MPHVSPTLQSLFLKNDVDKAGNLICAECHRPLIKSVEEQMAMTVTELFRHGEVVSTRNGTFINHRVCPL